MSIPSSSLSGPRGNSSSTSISNEKAAEQKTEVENLTDETAQKTLKSIKAPQSTFTVYDPRTWSIPSFWYKKSEASSANQTADQTKSVTIDDETSSGGQPDLEGSSDDKQEEEIVSISSSSSQNSKKFERELDMNNLPPVENPILESEMRQPQNEAVKNQESEEKKEGTEATAEKTEQASTGILNRWMGGLAGLGGGLKSKAKVVGSFAYNQASAGVKACGTKLVQHVAGNYSNQKAKHLAEAHQRIRNALPDDPQFIEFSNFVTNVVQHAANGKLDDDNLVQDGANEWVGDNLKNNKKLISDIIEINLTRGMANLAEQIKPGLHQKKDEHQPPALVKVLSLFCEKAEAHINMEKLSQVEQKYQQNRIEYTSITQKLVPFLNQEPEKQKIIQDLLQRTKDSQSLGTKDSKFLLLFPSLVELLREDDLELNFDFVSGRLKNAVEKYEKNRLDDPELGLTSLQPALDDLHRFINCIKVERQRNQEIHEIMNTLTDDILTYPFPKKVNDLIIPMQFLAGLPGIRSFIYNAVRELVSSFIQESYDPLAENLGRHQMWEATIQNHVGEIDTETLTKAPATLLLEGGKAYIQSNPKLVGQVKWALDEILENKKEEKGESSRSALVSDLSKTDLASWLVESLQFILHTEDPHLLNAGFFIQSNLKELTLSLLAKGSELVLPEGHQIEPDQLVKELMNSSFEKLKRLQQGESIPDDFWKTFVKDLPLPPLVKELLAKKLIEKAEIYQKEAVATFTDLQTIQELHAKAVEAIKQKGVEAEQFLAIADTISDQAVKFFSEKNIEFAPVKEKLESLLDQYLPDISVDEKWKTWFKKNMNALGDEAVEKNPEFVELIKKGAETVILNSLINTIEANFSNDSKEYAAQLLNNIHKAVSKSFEDVTEEKKQSLYEAMESHEKIKQDKAEIQKLQQKIALEPSNLRPNQLQMLKDKLKIERQASKAREYHQSLNVKREEILKDLNKLSGNTIWTQKTLVGPLEKVDQLEKVRLALVFRQMVQKEFISEKTQNPLLTELAFLNEKKNELALVIKSDPKFLEAQKNSEECQALIQLLSYPAEKLQLILDALSIDKTLKYTVLEHNKINEEFTKVNRLIESEDKRIQEYNEWASYHYDKNESKAEASELKKEPPLPISKEEWEAAKKSWENGVKWSLEVIENREKIKEKVQSNQDETKKLNTHLDNFRVLADEMTALIGLDNKKQLNLPSTLSDLIWPLFEEAKIEFIPAMLFEQISPMLMPVLEVEKNRQQLENLSTEKNILADLCRTVAEEVIVRIPEFVTSYKPFASLILKSAGQKDLTSEAINQMESLLEKQMFQLGQTNLKIDKLKPLLKKQVAENRVDQFAQVVEQAIKQADAKGVTKEAIYELLKQEHVVLSSHALEKKAKELTYQINTSIVSSGQNKLTEEELIKAYKNFPGVHLSAVDEEFLKSKFEEEDIVDKIKMVAISPEEIAHVINDAIPGATELHALLAPQIQEVISGQNEAFQKNRSLAKQYIEAMALRLIVKIADANGGEKGLETLTKKLNNLVQDPKLIQGRNPQEAVELIVDQFMKDIIGIASEDDLKGVPLILQELIYGKIKDQVSLQVGPMILPVIERTINSQRLAEISGSNMLGSMAEALSKDVFYLLPTGFTSYSAVAKNIFKELSGKEPDSAQLTAFANEINKLVEDKQEKNIKNKSILDAYIRVSQVNLNENQKQTLDKVVNEKNYKEVIKNIFITPEALSETFGNAFPKIKGSLQQSLANILQEMTRNEHEVYQNASGFVAQYVEGVLLRLFIKVAEKNPPEKADENDPSKTDKDSLVILTEHLLELVTAEYNEPQHRDFNEFAKILNKKVLQDILGINSKEDLEGLPPPLKGVAFKAIRDVLGNMAIKMYEGLQTVESSQPSVQKTKVELKRFGVEASTQRAYAEILAEDLGKMVASAVPNTLSEIVGDNRRGVNLISKNVESYLEELSRGNLQLAKVLLNYAQAPAFRDILDKNLAKVADQSKLVEEKTKAASFVSHILLEPLNRIFTRAVDLEEQKGAQFNRKLMANVLKVATGHIKTLNQANKLAVKEGRAHLSYADFVKASSQLHPATPTEPVSYQKTMQMIVSRIPNVLTFEQLVALEKEIKVLVKQEEKDSEVLTIQALIEKIQDIKGVEGLTEANIADLEAIKEGKSLKDFIREDANAINKQKQEAFYDPTTKVLLKMIFPNGKKDLTFVPEDVRGITWKMLKKNLFPQILPMLVETILDPNTIKKIVVNSLDTVKQSLQEPIVLDETIPEDPSLDELDAVSGHLMAEVLETIELPNWIKAKLKDPKTGMVSPAIAKSIGATLRKQFNDTFIKDKMETALKAAVQRNEKGEFSLSYDPSGAAEKLVARKQENAKMDTDLHNLSREVVDSSITYFVKRTWKQAQAKFDLSIENVAGKYGMKVKRALDKVFRFIFIKVMGSVLSFLTRPVQSWAKSVLYNYIKLDRNRDYIMTLLTRTPKDQPVDSSHVVYHEDLVYKMVQVMRETMEKAIQAPFSFTKESSEETKTVTS